MVEVPNVVRPYGAGVEEWFFQKPHVFNFSPSNLGWTFARAGLSPLKINSSHNLTLVARRGPDVTPRSFDEAVAIMPGLEAITAADIVATLAEHDRRENASPGAIVEKWLLGTPAALIGEDALRTEVNAMAAQLGVQISTLIETLHAVEHHGEQIVKDMHPDPLTRAFRNGQSFAWLRAHMLLTHLVNTMVYSATKGAQ
jgi:hypothetical protein